MKIQSWIEMCKWGVLAAVFMLAMPDLAVAQSGGGTGDTAGAIANQVATSELIVIPKILAMVCYILGLFLLISGMLKLKAYAEKPESEKMGPGIARIIIGGLITALPALSQVVQNTTRMNGSGNAKYTGFTGLWQ